MTSILGSSPENALRYNGTTESVEIMLIPSFWRGRAAKDRAGDRIAQFRALMQSARKVPFYCKQMDAKGMRTVDFDLEEIPKTLEMFEPLSWDKYRSLFTGRIPGWRQRPEQRQTRSALMVPYAEARAGLGSCRIEPASYADLYSATAMARATADLYRFAKSVADPPDASNLDPDSDCAMVVFSGMDAGAFTAEQRDELWDRYQVPVFEHFVGTDGRVIASECEVHNGLHIRLDGAILEAAGNEILLTSLSDLEAPAIRVRTGLKGPIEYDVCNCGRVEPRIFTARAVEETPELRVAACA
ncbi:hypothetical protein [Nevskia soli]|jgi:hypothetical protein|uniref:hypothetical protein n=1 Tax=Nevskia soli TaxID=418856 RepID=UPI0015D8BC13|nr:hypothetical protein [Nevskia soli]